MMSINYKIGKPPLTVAPSAEVVTSVQQTNSSLISFTRHRDVSKIKKEVWTTMVNVSMVRSGGTPYSRLVYQ